MAVKKSNAVCLPLPSTFDSETRKHSSGERKGRASRRNSNSSRESAIEFEPLNDLISSSNHTTLSTSNSSFGESSLSSFLSTLLEEEHGSENMTINIVTDNPRTEHNGFQDLRAAFKQTTIEKPKCKWEYLTRDTSDQDLVWRGRNRRGKLEIRSSSFSGAISSSKCRRPSRRSASIVGCEANSVLKKPERRKSPKEEAEFPKKSIMERLNRSDTNLLALPLPMSSGRNRSHGQSSNNASWSLQDVQEKRESSQKQYFDALLEPDDQASNAHRRHSTPTLSSSSQSSTRRRTSKEKSSVLSSSRREKETKKMLSSSGLKDVPPMIAMRTKSPRISTRRMKSPPPDAEKPKFPLELRNL